MGRLLAAMGLVLLLLAAATGAALAQSAVSGDRVREIAEKLQCPVCQGTSVADSRSQVAQDMRSVIRAKLEAGESEQQILGYFQERYGPAILREPPRTGLYSAVWWGPGLALVLGAAIIYGMMRRHPSSEKGGAAPAPVQRGDEQEADMPPEELEAYRARIRALERGGPP